MQDIYLDRDQVPASILGAYAGRKIRVHICENVALRNRAWDGGTRSQWSMIRLADGASTLFGGAAFTAPSQFGGLADDPIVPIPAGSVIVERVTFCGADHGIVIHARQDDIAPILPAKPSDLSNAERVVLRVTKCLKSSYGGRNPRIDAATGSYSYERGGLPAITLAEYHAAQVSLISRGFLNARGAITTAGKNAI